MSWRDEEITEQQLNYIAMMEEFSEYPLPRFTGTTKGEASDYIKKWEKIAHETLINAYERTHSWEKF